MSSGNSLLCNNPTVSVERGVVRAVGWFALAAVSLLGVSCSAEGSLEVSGGSNAPVAVEPTVFHLDRTVAQFDSLEQVASLSDLYVDGVRAGTTTSVPLPKAPGLVVEITPVRILTVHANTTGQPIADNQVINICVVQPDSRVPTSVPASMPESVDGHTIHPPEPPARDPATDISNGRLGLLLERYSKSDEIGVECWLPVGGGSGIIEIPETGDPVSRSPQPELRATAITPARVDVLASLVGSRSLGLPSGATPPVFIQPSIGLVDGQTVNVAINDRDLSNSSVGIVMCTDDALSRDVAACDLATLVVVTTDESGEAHVEYAVHQRIQVDGVTHDCAQEHCRVGVGSVEDPSKRISQEVRFKQ